MKSINRLRLAERRAAKTVDFRKNKCIISELHILDRVHRDELKVLV